MFFGPLFSEALALQPAIRPAEVNELEIIVTDGASRSGAQPAGSFFGSAGARAILVNRFVFWGEPYSASDCFLTLKHTLLSFGQRRERALTEIHRCNFKRIFKPGHSGV
jgi:hypothetical protein